MNRWFVSDFHLGHVNIRKYCPWFREHFESTEVMNDFIVNQWRETVKQEDEVYFLGDFAMANWAVEKYLPLLPGRISWILGNHDGGSLIHKKHEKMRKWYRELNPNIVALTQECMINIGKYAVLLHHFPYLNEPDSYSHEDYEVRYKEWRPIRGKRYTDFACHGHTHVQPGLRLKNDSLSVCWDSWGRLVSEEEIHEIIKEQKKCTG